jgi:hypothetical protein
MITLNNINLSSIDLSGIDLRGIKLGLGGRGGGSGDGFPQLPGDVTRWHFGGLTNEMMAAMDDPRIEDADHKGRFLSFKNFAWGGMSGVNGYVQNFNDFRNNATVDKIRIDEQNSNSIKVTILTTGIGNAIFILKSVYQFNKSYFIKISSEGYNEGDLSLSFYAPSTSTATTVKVPLNPNGITEIPAIKEDDFLAVYLNVGGKVGSITIEQLPLYPGALVFDGVDDYGTCDNFPILTKEKGYTVVALRSYLAESIGYLVYNGTSAKQSAFAFERSDSLDTWSWGINSSIRNSLPKLMSYQTSNSYNNNPISTGEVVESNNIINVAYGGGYSNVAIWEIVILDHDATEEELTKIKDYFVKTYPWLFPDQAWTVVGKTNEDEDRATIANITGNGNDLVLSNVAFSENSGYGSYPFGMNVWNPDYIADQPYGTVHYPNDSKSYATTVKNNATNFRIKFRLRGLPEGGSFLIRVFDMNDLNTALKTYTYTENGIHEFVYNDPNKPARIILYNGNAPSNISEFYLDIIPEYEGYLVTDGVEDKVQSSSFTMNEDWTIVGDWELLSNVQINCGIVKAQNVYLYNIANGLLISINNPRSLQSFGTKSLHAICSDGRLYDRNWVEYEYTVDQNFAIVESSLNIGFNLNNYTQIAFKNLGIYNNQILSKEDCIKAYNYLQTLKAK